MLMTLLWTACLDTVAPLPQQQQPVEEAAPVELPPPPPDPPRNEPPTIERLAVSPNAIDTNTDIHVQVNAKDPDGPPPQLIHEWSINGRTILEVTTDVLPHSYFQKGDEIKVKVTANDGVDQRFQTLSLTVGNASPAFVTDPRNVNAIDNLTLEVSDPDEADEITFRMTGAPQGMRIGETSGTISYEGRVDEPGGDYTIQIVAEDGDGGEATWEFSISVQPGSQAPQP